MDTRKVTILTMASIISIAIVLIIIQLLLRKLKQKSSIEGKFKASYGIWFSTLFIAAIIITSKALSILSEAIDNINKLITENQNIEIAKTTSIFLGLGALWFIIWFYISNLLAVVIVGNRKDVNEIEADNYYYFLIKGILLIGFIFCLFPVFEIMLRAFMPSIKIPFYH